MNAPDTKSDEAEATTTPKSSSFWQTQIELAEKQHKPLWDDGAAYEERYKCDRDSVQKAQRGRKFNVIYSNTETMRSAYYARAPKPDVRQRWTQGQDKLSRTVADMIERSLSYSIDTTSHEKAFKAGVKDFTIAGRGVIKVCYEPEMGKADGGQEVITGQKIYCEHVYYKDFLASPAKSWLMVWWVAFRHVMTRDDLANQGFDDADTVPLNWVPDGYKATDCPEELKRAEIWEVWHKAKRERLWIVKGHPTILRRDADPYQLQEFWPMPEPIQALVTNGSYIPVSIIKSYIDQADELDAVTNRISRLTDALKRRGVYDASVKELKRLARAQDNEYIPADNYAAFVQSGGLKGAFQTEDLKPIADVLMGLYEQRDRLIQAIYETTGVSDIMRGMSQASETATAQQLKANFGSSRMRDMQQDVQRWVRDALRIQAEMICEHFEPDILMQMTGIKLPSLAEVQAQAVQQQMMAAQTGQPMPPQQQPMTIDDVMQVMRSDKLRSFQVDIESDSTVFEDASQEKQDRVELLGAMSQFVQGWLPAIQMGGPPMMKLGLEMMAFGVRGFKAGRQMEDAIDEARSMMEQAAQAPPQPEPPDPKVEGEKIKLEGIKMKAEADAQKVHADMAKTQMGMQAATQKHGLEMERMQAKAAQDALMNGRAE